MNITIDLEDSAPLFSQLVNQIKQAVQKRELEPGAQLPSIRQLAMDLDLNNKTVAKAYRLLERDAVIQSRGYRGTFVHPDALANCKVDIPELIRETLVSAINSCRNIGATDSEIRIAFSQLMQNQTV
jgi:GntR family transcriptional regulator